jgi:hypothetical protein
MSEKRRSVEKAPDASFAPYTVGGFACVMRNLFDFFFGLRWLNLSEEDERTANIKASFNEEKGRIAILSALLLGMMFKQSMSSSVAWLDVASTGWIARTLEPSFGTNPLQGDWVPFWHDVDSFGWHLAADLLLVGVVMCTFQLLLSNELDNDMAIKVFVSQMGPLARSVAWISVLFGMVIPFVLSKSFRMILSQQTLPGVIVRCSLSFLVFIIFPYTAYKNLHAFYMTAEEESKWEPIQISDEDMEKLAAEYFEKNPKKYALAKFIGSLTETTKLGYTISLTYESTMLAKKHFYMKAGEKFGLQIGPETLTQLCFDLAPIQAEPDWTL